MPQCNGPSKIWVLILYHHNPIQIVTNCYFCACGEPADTVKCRDLEVSVDSFYITVIKPGSNLELLS